MNGFRCLMSDFLMSDIKGLNRQKLCSESFEKYKRIELLREMLPGAKRIGLLGDPNDPRLAGERNALAPVATALGLTIIVGEASNPVEFDAAVAKLIGQASM